MAFLQTDYPPSTAPASRRARVRRPRAVPSRPRGSFGRVRALLLIAALVAVAVPGYMAFVATGSLALGILSSDFVFLIAIAAWSSVSRG